MFLDCLMPKKLHFIKENEKKMKPPFKHMPPFEHMSRVLFERKKKISCNTLRNKKKMIYDPWWPKSEIKKSFSKENKKNFVPITISNFTGVEV